MKKLLTILLLCFPAALMAQYAVPYSGEYQVGFLFSGGVMKTGGGGSTGQGTSNTVANKGILQNIHFADGKTRVVLFAFSGLHTFYVVTAGPTGTTTGDTLWVTGLNDGWIMGSSTAAATTSFNPILLDNSGGALTNLIGGWASATAGLIDTSSFVFVWKIDGTLWRIGNSTGGLTGDGTTGNSRHVDSFFVQVPATFGGHKIVKVRGMFFPIALDDAGIVYTWGNQNYIGYQLGQAGDYRTPGIVSLGGHTALDIASTSLASHVITNDHHLWGWSFYSAMLGIGVHWSGTTNHNTPTDLTSAQGLTGLTYSSISNVEETFYAIMSNNSMRAWGDNPEGTGGVIGDAGYMIDMTATTPVQYNYNGGQGENIIPLPLDPFASCAKTVVHTPEGGYFQRDGWVVTFDGTNYHYWHLGRNKNAVGLFRVNGDPGFQQEGTYPDWNMDSIPTERDITSTNETVAEAQYCNLNHAAAACRANYNPPAEANPTVNAGSNQTISITTATMAGSATPAAGHSIKRYQWTGPCGVLFANAFSATSGVSGLSSGANILTLTATDDADKLNTSTVTITVSSSAQTTFCIATAGSGTACTSAAPCPLSYLPTLIPLLVPGDSLLFNRGDKFTGTLSIGVSGTQASPIYIGAYGSGVGPAFDNRLTLTLTGGGANQTGTCTGCTANTRLLLFNGVPVSQARTPNMPQVFTYTPGSSTTTVLAVNSADLTAVGTITGKKVGIFPFPYAQAQGTVSSQTTNTVTFSPAMPTGFTGGNGWWVNGTTPDTIGEYTYSGGTSGTFTVNGSAGQTVQAATVDTTIAIYGNYVKVADANIFGANTVLLYLGGIGDSAFHDTTAFSGMDGVEVNARRVHINRISTNYCNNIGINNLSLSDTGTSILNNTVLNSGTLPGMQQTGNSQAIGIVSPGYGSVIKYNTVANSGGNAIYSGGADSIWVRKNYIHDFNQTWIDGGGIYFWVNSAVTATFGRFIDSNLIENGGVHPWSFIGKSINNSSASFAVYLDSHTNGVTVSNNTGWNMVSGFGQNHGPSNTWTNNSFGQDQYVGFLNAQFVGGPTLTSVVFSGNTSYDSLPAVPLIRNITLGNDSTTILTADNNVYVHATNTFAFWTKNASNAGAWFNVAGWRTASGQDAHSTFQGLKCTIVTNPLFTVADQKFGYVGKSVDGKSSIYRNIKKAQPSISGSILQVVNIGQFWKYRKTP